MQTLKFEVVVEVDDVKGASNLDSIAAKVKRELHLNMTTYDGDTICRVTINKELTKLLTNED
jgi:hypothetical protein